MKFVLEDIETGGIKLWPACDADIVNRDMVGRILIEPDTCKGEGVIEEEK